MSELKVEIIPIDEIQSHSNADKLELAIINGRQCIVPKGKYKTGDVVVYIPLDSILPTKLSEQLGIAEYMNHSNGRVRAVRLRGEKSFGIVCDIDIASMESRRKYFEGKKVNLASELNITKYNPDAHLKQGWTRRQRPKRYMSIIQKLIIFRKKWKSIGWKQAIKSLVRMFGLGFPLNNEIFNKYGDIENLCLSNFRVFDGIVCAITEKIHGTNFRAGWINGEWMVGSHNINLEEDTNSLWWKMSTKYPLKEILKNNQIIYGEIFGEGIQKITYGRKDPDIYFFDLSEETPNGRKYMDYLTLREFLSQNSLPMVPTLYVGKLSSSIVSLVDSLNMIMNKCSFDKESIMEGVVIRPYYEEIIDPKIGRPILKCKSEKFLLGDFE